MDRLLGLLTAPLLPAWALATALHPRWRRDLRERWGVALPPVQPGAVWVHAASVGEVGAAWGLVQQLPDPVLLTADTDTGAARARALARSRPGVAAGARPVDHPWTLAPLWAEARPRAVVFVEGTYWPALAWRARRAGVPVFRVSAKLGPRTARFGPLLRAWWWPVDRVWARDPASAAALAPLHRGPVEVGGDLKQAAPPPPGPLTWSRPFAVGASTRPGDEERLLDAVDGDLQLLIAPRHPARFDEVAALLDRRVRWVRRSALSGPVPADVDAVLLDTVGELAGCCAGAEFAFIGGTFDPAIGGHSPWEAASAGVPIVAGPHGRSQGDAFARVHASLSADLRAAIAARRPPPPVEPARIDLLRWVGAPAPESSPRPWLAPAAAVYGAVASARRLAYDRGWLRSERVGVPVISVGSANARSPGRTSVAAAAVRALAARGHRVGVAVRGYRRADRSGRVRVSWEDASAAALGDEGALHALAGAEVAAGPDRVEAARRLVARGCTVIVLDDGLQHRRLHRNLDWVVVDARYPGARGLLPMGEARERDPRGEVVVQHASALFDAPGWRVARRLGPWSRPPSSPAVAVAGIGRAADFFATLDVPVRDTMALADHQPYDDAAVARILAWAGDDLVLTTAKDAARMPAALRGRAAWRDVVVELPEGLLASLSRYRPVDTPPATDS